MKRSQFIATILAVACAGSLVSTAQACETRLQPVGELVTTSTFVSPRPLYTARIIERPAPVAERITTRRITTVRTLAPVGERIITRRAYLAPVAERVIVERPAFRRTVIAPVAERVMVTKYRPTFRSNVLRTTTLAPVGERVLLCP